MRSFLPRALWWTGVLALVAGCATLAERADRVAAEHGFSREEIAAGGFRLVVYRKAGEGRALHLYLEGDGTPWVTERRPAEDPTPRAPLMLRLMALDPAPAAYVGRPCYFGQAAAPGCAPLLWTHERYSERVVAAMAEAIGALRAESGEASLALLGHSGGGTLAMLLAERLPEVRAVLTIGGNLDPDAWAAHHGYTPLSGSLNPSKRPPLPARVLQLHAVGLEDDNIPLESFRAAAARQSGAIVRELPDVGHAEGWESLWPALLRELPE